MTIIITIIDLSISAFVLGLGLFVLFKDPKKKINQLFGLTIIFFASWIVSSSLSDITGFLGSEFGALFWAKAAIIGPFLLCSTFLHFTYYFPNKNQEVGWLKFIAIYSVPVLSLIFVPTKHNVESISLESWGTNFTPGFLYLILFPVLFIYLGFALYRVYRNYRKSSSSREKAQLFYVFVGMASFLIIGPTTNLILPVFWGIAQLSVIGPSIAMFIFATLTAYAILVHHLLDVWFVVRLGTIFTILFAAISFIYVGIIGLLGNYVGGIPSLVLASFLITFTFEPLKKFIESKTDKIFFRKHYRLEEVINEATATVHRLELNLNKISLSFNRLIERYFKSESAAVAILTPGGSFLVKASLDDVERQFELPVDNPILEFMNANMEFILNKGEIESKISSGDLELDVDKIELLPAVYQELSNLNFHLAIPIEVSEKLIGIYFIGEKKSKDVYTTQDLKLLDHLTSEAGGLINNARLYEDLKKLDEAKSNFISVVSHQLRTPISAMRWTTELLLDGALDKRLQQEFLRDNYKNSIFIIYHIDDMLTALDIEDKKVELKKESCDLKNLVEEILEDNSQIIKNKNIKIKTDYDWLPGELFCDCKKLKKIMEVILANAFNYAPDSGGEVEMITLKKAIGDSDYLEVSVSDNGIGISEEEQGYIFEKFFRGEEAKRSSPNGFGLGLFIVKSFVEAHGGEIHFESGGRAKGAKFYFTIPLGQ